MAIYIQQDVLFFKKCYNRNLIKFCEDGKNVITTSISLDFLERPLLF